MATTMRGTLFHAGLFMNLINSMQPSHEEPLPEDISGLLSQPGLSLCELRGLDGLRRSGVSLLDAVRVLSRYNLHLYVLQLSHYFRSDANSYMYCAKCKGQFFALVGMQDTRTCTDTLDRAKYLSFYQLRKLLLDSENVVSDHSLSCHQLFHDQQLRCNPSEETRFLSGKYVYT